MYKRNGQSGIIYISGSYMTGAFFFSFAKEPRKDDLQMMKETNKREIQGNGGQ